MPSLRIGRGVGETSANLVSLELFSDLRRNRNEVVRATIEVLGYLPESLNQELQYTGGKNKSPS